VFVGQGARLFPRNAWSETRTGTVSPAVNRNSCRPEPPPADAIGTFQKHTEHPKTARNLRGRGDSTFGFSCGHRPSWTSGLLHQICWGTNTRRLIGTSPAGAAARADKGQRTRGVISSVCGQKTDDVISTISRVARDQPDVVESWPGDCRVDALFRIGPAPLGLLREDERSSQPWHS